MKWPPKILARLEELFLQSGMSQSQIAQALSTEFGMEISRNAVIGKLSRIRNKAIQAGDTKRLDPAARIGGKSRQPPPRAQPAGEKRRPTAVGPSLFREGATRASRVALLHARPAESVPIGDSKTVLIEELTDEKCRWPIGDVPPYHYCGHKPVEGLPYCAGHARAAYAPSEARRGSPRYHYRKG